jgi:excisionase family DNA binding protein
MRNMENKLLTTTEAARILGCSASTVRRMLDHGVLRGYRIPMSTHRRVAQDEVERLKKTLTPEA